VDRITNPYRPTAGGQPPELVGRSELLTAADVAIAQTLDKRPPQCILLTGVRGVGKTVALRTIEKLGLKRGAHSIFLEATDDEQFPLALARGARETIYNFDGTLSRTSKAALGVLKSFTLTLGAEGLGLGIKEPAANGQGDSGNIESDVRDVVSALGKAAEAHKSGVVITIDELQYLSKEELASVLGALHRTTQLDLPVLLVAAGLPNLPRRIVETKTYAERMFAVTQLGPLGRDDVRRALQGPAMKHDVIFSEDAVNEIDEMTQGYPFFVQTWGYETWNAAEKSPITIEDVHAASATARAYLDKTFFRARAEHLTQAETQYLRKLAELGAGPQRASLVAEHLSLPPKSTSSIRDRLIKKGTIYAPNHGGIEFSVPLFDDFLRRQPDGVDGASQGRAPRPRGR
jgi:hypothetical protein